MPYSASLSIEPPATEPTTGAAATTDADAEADADADADADAVAGASGAGVNSDASEHFSVPPLSVPPIPASQQHGYSSGEATTILDGVAYLSPCSRSSLVDVAVRMVVNIADRGSSKTPPSAAAEDTEDAPAADAAGDDAIPAVAPRHAGPSKVCYAWGSCPGQCWELIVLQT